MADPPNILFLHSHNTGQYVQPYGYAVPTPHLQRLAEEGVLFRQAFAAAPTCSPSRASFLTGLTPHSCGMLGLAHRGFAMTDYGQHLVQVLGSRNQQGPGYFTALAGVEHTAPDITVVGYDAILSDADVNYAHATNPQDPAQAAVAFLESSPPEPFFLSVGLEETHRPFPAPDPARHPAEDPRYCRPPAALPDTPELRADMAAFKAAARVMDHHIGAVLAALDRTGLAERTTVFCFSDHGLQFPRHMATLTDRGIAVYLIVRGPGGFGGGQVIDAMVSLADLALTVYDLAGIQAPSWLQGPEAWRSRSLRALVVGEADSLHDAIFAECNYHAAYEPLRCIRTGRYKLIRRYGGRSRPVLPNVDESPGKKELLEHDWAEQALDPVMLFDLALDPEESYNLAGRPTMASVRAELEEKLDRWMRETGDPLLVHEVVPAPPGARIDDPDWPSPKTVLHRRPSGNVSP